MSLLQHNIEFLQKDRGINLSSPIHLEELKQLAASLEVPLENLLTFNLATTDLPWNELKFVFLDVDGVLTEGGMFYTESGDEFKRFDTKDGMGIKTTMKEGLQFGIISSGVNQTIIQHRADMFGIEHVYVGKEPKLQIAEKWLAKLGISWNQTGYIGDDINDLDMFEKCGISACPADASLPNRQAADFVLQSNGGHGCVREFLRHHPKFQSIL